LVASLLLRRAGRISAQVGRARPGTAGQRAGITPGDVPEIFDAHPARVSAALPGVRRSLRAGRATCDSRVGIRGTVYWRLLAM